MNDSNIMQRKFVSNKDDHICLMIMFTCVVFFSNNLLKIIFMNRFVKRTNKLLKTECPFHSIFTFNSHVGVYVSPITE